MTLRRWLLVMAALGVGLVLGLALDEARRPSPSPGAPEPPAVPPTIAATAPLAPDAAVPAPPATGALATAATFTEGFCDPEGDGIDWPHRLLLTRLAGLVRTGGRLAADEAALLRRALGPPERAGSRAVEEGERLAALRPDSPWPWVALGLLHGAAGETGPELTSFRRARERAPAEPTLGLALALATRNEPDLDEAFRRAVDATLR